MRNPGIFAGLVPHLTNPRVERGLNIGQTRVEARTDVVLGDAQGHPAEGGDTSIATLVGSRLGRSGVPERMIDFERDFGVRPGEVETHTRAVVEGHDVLDRGRGQPDPVDRTQYAILQIGLNRGRPLTLRLEDMLDLT